nr:XRE family transcriptional regulator [Micromonospora sp. DSM 115978]
YWTAPARLLYEATYAHTCLGVDLVRSAASGQRAAHASGLAQSALLTARLAFFDLAQPAVAARCYDVALTASKEAGDHALAAAVLGHMAFVPAFHHDPAGARNLIVAALHHSRHGVSATVRSWLHCVLSEVEARAGAGATSRRQVDLAESALDDDRPVPPWFDFYDATRLE